jgi:hypothetical protein
MDGINKFTVSWLAKLHQNSKHRHLQTDDRSVATTHSRMVANPHFSLKARMLGGHAERIMRLGGLSR